MGIFTSELAIHTASLERKNGTDQWGDTTYDDAVTVACRIEHGRRQATTPDATEVVSTTQIFTEASTQEGDRWTITVDGNSKTKFALEAMKHYDLDGNFSHYEVIL